MLNTDGNVEFLSTPSARRATRPQQRQHRQGPISIHALREEGDLRRCTLNRGKLISIHALREEGDCWFKILTGEYKDFYPRPPRGGRPCKSLTLLFIMHYFYPRPPRGGRRTTPLSIGWTS